MKHLTKILISLILFIWILSISNVYAGVNWLDSVQWIDQIKKQSVINIPASWNITDDIQDTWYKTLTIIKTIVSALLIIFIVYIWIQMITSMWSDEEQLGKAKQQLRYTLMWLIFINIPWSLYNAFVATKGWAGKAIDWAINWTWSTPWTAVWKENVFINITNFTDTINWGIVLFIEASIFSIAIFMIILSGIKIIISMWKEEDITEAKNKIIWSLVWLVFVWFIESWQNFLYDWNLKDWTNIFETIQNLALFLAWPIAIFFLTLAWYHYITANGDDEKIKKAKNIVINTIIATVILMAAHLFLQDLIWLNI